MTPRLRKLALTGHITATVGWLGALAAFLALAVVGLTDQDAQLVRATYLMMETLAWYVLVPLALASLLTGVVQGLGTAWGLFRHYWVVFKLLITVIATIVLLMYTQTLNSLGDSAAQAPLAGDPDAPLRSISPVLHAGVGLLLLLAATILAVYKPAGLTRYGRRKQKELRARRAEESRSSSAAPLRET